MAMTWTEIVTLDTIVTRDEAIIILNEVFRKELVDKWIRLTSISSLKTYKASGIAWWAFILPSNEYLFWKEVSSYLNGKLIGWMQVNFPLPTLDLKDFIKPPAATITYFDDDDKFFDKPTEVKEPTKKEKKKAAVVKENYEERLAAKEAKEVDMRDKEKEKEEKALRIAKKAQELIDNAMKVLSEFE